MRTSVRMTSVAFAVPVFMVFVLAAPVRTTTVNDDIRFDVNDMSVLWPPPSTAAEVATLITADDVSPDGKRIFPPAVFKQLMETAQTVQVQTPVTAFKIDFEEFAPEFALPATWKLVSFRVDPSAPGGHGDVVKVFGSTPQLRLVFQPVTMINGGVRVHDVTAHLAFSYAMAPAAGAPPFPVTPNKDAFRQVVNDLKDLKAAAGGAKTAGELRVHPALAAKVPGFPEKLRSFLQRRSAQGVLTDLAFMGIRPPEPWIFFAMRRNPSSGAFDRVHPKALGGEDAQMLIMFGPKAVVPAPVTANVAPHGGVSTAQLFKMAPGQPAKPVFASAAKPLHQDIPDIIANPRMSNVLNTDCVSCHSESTRRRDLGSPASDAMFAFARPAGISGVAANHLPQSVWNVRNFGWFQRGEGAPIEPTISMRTANETAEAVEFTNREYLSPAPSAAPAAATRSQPAMSTSVANPLTLVMTIKSAQDFTALKTKIEQMQSLPPDKNPIVVALEKLKTVHFARFVFLSERQLAVITAYDGSFEDYIDAFATSIGDVFDSLLEHMVDAPPRPVKKPENRKAFLEYVRKNDLKAIPPFYSAYPSLGVLDILTLQKQGGV